MPSRQRVRAGEPFQGQRESADVARLPRGGMTLQMYGERGVGLPAQLVHEPELGQGQRDARLVADGLVRGEYPARVRLGDVQPPLPSSAERQPELGELDGRHAGLLGREPKRLGVQPLGRLVIAREQGDPAQA